MKNIHILPTDKTSRLFLSPMNNLKLSDEVIGNLYQGLKPQNIYITSPEEIKEGDWFIHSSHEITTLLKAIDVRGRILDNQGTSCNIDYCKKIILTTDPSLAPDVQKIDDEFLEWFVGKAKDSGKPIDIVEIQKDEAKQYPIAGYAPGFYSCKWVNCKIEFTGDKRAVQCEPCAIKTTKEEPKQERMYSEEEVLGILVKAMKDVKIEQLTFFDGGSEYPIYSNLSNWFEQFKNK